MHRSEHRRRGFLFSGTPTHFFDSMIRSAIAMLSVTRQPAFAVLADGWRASVGDDARPRRIAGVVSTLESQRITTHAGGPAEALA
jgi:hypothetical protein